MATQQKRPPAAVRRFNKIAVKAAGTRLVRPWAAIEHTGRTSGKTYTTPIAIVASTPDQLYIALPWGPGTDWVRNLRAAGGGKVRWRGTTYAATEPTIVGRSEAVAAAGRVQRRIMTRVPTEQFLRLRREPAR